MKHILSRTLDGTYANAMRTGPIVISGLILWIISKVSSNAFWIHNLKISSVALVIVLTAGFVWILKQENRKGLALIYSNGILSNFSEFVVKGWLFAYIIVIFVIAIAFFEALQQYVISTDAYYQVEQVIRSDSELQSQVGTVVGVGVGNSFSYKNNYEELNLSLNVFGELKSTTVQVTAVKEGNIWNVKIDNNGK